MILETLLIFTLHAFNTTNTKFLNSSNPRNAYPINKHFFPPSNTATIFIDFEGEKLGNYTFHKFFH